MNDKKATAKMFDTSNELGIQQSYMAPISQPLGLSYYSVSQPVFWVPPVVPEVMSVGSETTGCFTNFTVVNYLKYFCRKVRYKKITIQNMKGQKSAKCIHLLYTV